MDVSFERYKLLINFKGMKKSFGSFQKSVGNMLM